MERRETSVCTGTLSGGCGERGRAVFPVSFQVGGEGKQESGEQRRKEGQVEYGSLPAPAVHLHASIPPGTRPPPARSPGWPPIHAPWRCLLASLFPPTSPPHHSSGSEGFRGPRFPPRAQRAFLLAPATTVPGLRPHERRVSGASRRLHGMAVHGSGGDRPCTGLPWLAVGRPCSGPGAR